MKKTRFIAMVLVLFLIISNLTVGFAIVDRDKDLYGINYSIDEEVIIPVIIELNNSSLLEYSEAKTMGAEKFLESATATNIRNRIILGQDFVKSQIISKIDRNIEFGYTYTTVLNGFSAKIKVGDLAKIKALPDVKRVYFDQAYDAPTPQMITSGDVVFANQLKNYGYSGKSMLVSVIDTGLDVEHEIMVLGQEGKDSMKLTRDGLIKKFNDVVNSNGNIKLNALTKMPSLTAEQAYQNEKFPFVFNYADSEINVKDAKNEHGMHVAGIIGANGTVASKTTTLGAIQVFDGIAPEAQILGMKVFSKEGGGAVTSVTIAAIEDSVYLGADVINLSLGSPAGFTYYKGLEDWDEFLDYEYEEAFKKAREAGVLIVVAAGNDNRVGQGGAGFAENNSSPTVNNPDTAYISSPGTKYSSLAVASIENVQYAYSYFKASGNEFMFSDNCEQYVDRSFISDFAGKGEIEYVYCGKGEKADFQSVDIVGKIALIKRGGNTFTQKVNNAGKAGAIGCIVFNDNEENKDEIIGLSTPNLTTTITAISVSLNTGEKLLELENNDQNKVEFSYQFEKFKDNPDSMKMSKFSSWGATPDLKLKPEITAPGGNIYSTYSNSRYGMMSGTSMSSPIVAGASAILLEALNDRQYSSDSLADKVRIVENIMMSTANVVYNTESAKIDIPYSPRLQGAGLLNIEGALNTNAYLVNNITKKAKVELDEINSNNFEISFEVVNFSEEDAKYSISGIVMTDGNDDIYITREGRYIENTVIKMNGNDIPVNGDATSGSGNVITVEAGQRKEILLNVELSNDTIEELSKIFVNGFFVEGFIQLKSENAEKPDLGIPYMGFYGGWDSAPVVDNYSEYYDATNPEAKLPYYKDPNAYAYATSTIASRVVKLGYHLGSETVAKEEYISFSPNGDRFKDNVGRIVDFLRNVKSLKIYIEDSNNNVVRTILEDNEYYAPKTIYSTKDLRLTSHKLDTWDGKDENGEVMEGGQYYYVIETGIDHEGAKTSINKMPVYLDKTAPTATAKYNKETGTISVEASDNFYITYIELYDADTFDTIDMTEWDLPLKEAKVDLNMYDWESQNVVVYVSDIAGNRFEYEMDLSEEESEDPVTPVDPDPVDPDPADPTPVDPGTPSDPTPVDPITPTPVDPVEPTIPEEEVPGGQVVPIEQFTDVKEDDWFYNDVKAVLEKGLMNGVGENQFAPLGNATRATIATVIHRMASLPEFDAEKVVAFSDVVADEWYEKAVNWASSTEIVKGYEDGKFKPSKNISREELAAMLYRYVATLGKGYEEGWTYEFKFVDSEEVSDWSLEAISWMNENGIINGKDGNRLDPKGTATRAEIATMINRLSDFLSK